jgi:hypothetical protein
MPPIIRVKLPPLPIVIIAVVRGEDNISAPAAATLAKPLITADEPPTIATTSVALMAFAVMQKIVLFYILETLS